MLDDAIAAVKARARGRCRACQVDARADKDLAGTVRHLRMHETQHTCHGDLAAVRDCMLAAARQPYTCLTEIERLLPEGTEEERVRAAYKLRDTLPEGSEGGKE